MKKRIGNDITFTWHIYRKDGDTQVPESFADKDVEVKLISPLQRPVTIEDVSIATGVVAFTFRGKHQVTLGNYVAVLLENKGEDGMVTLDVVNAVTLVPHSYMEEDGDDGDVIEAESVELESTISASGGGGFVQQQADWAQTDASAVDFIKNKPDLDEYVPKKDDDGHGNMSMYSPGNITMTRANEQGVINQTGAFWAGGWSVSSPDGKFQTFGNSIYRGTMGFDHDSVVWEKTATHQIPAATTEANGLMSAEDKGKLNALPTDAELTEELAGLVNTGNYNTVSKKIELKHDNTVLAEIDATAFIKDGMVSSVTINNGYLVITFNTDAGKEPISIALTDIFNPANYYTKTQVDNALSDKLDDSGSNYGVYNRVLKISGLQDQDGYEYIRNGMHLPQGLEIYYYDYKTIITGEDIVVHSKGEPEDGSVSLRALAREVDGKANTSDLAEVATSGSYNDLSDTPTIPDITGKADKVNNATNGNFAALDSNGNLIDSGHKHSDYLTQHQDLSNYVQKSQTTGLLKNDGTVDTTQYLSQHQDISGKADKSEMSVVPGTDANADKTTITLKQGTSATVLTVHQDISGKEDITPIEAVASGTTTINAQVNKYYEVAGTVSSLTVTLPTPTANTEVTMVVVHLTIGNNPLIVVTSVNEVVKFSATYSVVANKEYELSCLYNGSKWIVSSMEVAI